MELSSPETRSVTEPLAEWSEKKIRLDGRPFRFEEHEYLREIYNDTSPHVVLSKAAQIGGTTWAILRSIHACLAGLEVMYFFPTRTDVIDFSKSRVGPLLRDNPFLKELMSDTDTAGLKRIAESHLYLRGMQSTVGMKSVPADLVVFDELDEAAPAAKAMAMERLAHSSYKRVIELSNPSLPDFGIDEQFQKSDQRHWTLRCLSCNTWTCLEREFPDRLGQEVKILMPDEDSRIYRACPKCSAELDPEIGEWVADYPDRKIRGYRISQLFSSKVDPSEILDEYRNTRYPDRFYNLKIGIPWADLSRRLNEAAVLSLCGDAGMLESNEDGWVVMGVDTGKSLHAVILRTGVGGNYRKWEVIRLAVCHEFSELDELIKRFSVSCVVIDGLPETHATRDFVERTWNGFLCFFNEHQRGAPAWNDDARTVLVNRTEALDASRSAIRSEQVALPRQCPLVEEFAKHMAADAKVLDEDEETGIQKYRYIRTGADHFSLAFTYAWLATEAPVGRPFTVDDIALMDELNESLWEAKGSVDWEKVKW